MPIKTWFPGDSEAENRRHDELSPNMPDPLQGMSDNIWHNYPPCAPSVSVSTATNPHCETNINDKLAQSLDFAPFYVLGVTKRSIVDPSSQYFLTMYAEVGKEFNGCLTFPFGIHGNKLGQEKSISRFGLKHLDQKFDSKISYLRFPPCHSV